MTTCSMLELSVIAPCFNEQDNVDELAVRVTRVFDELGIEAELILVDDGSSDGTWSYIQRRCAADARVVGSRHQVNRGIEGGWRTGLRMARGDLICLIDSDLQNRPEDIARLYDVYLRERPDIVQAVRRPKGVRTRRLFSRALKQLLNVTFGMRLRDNKSGFVLCSREALEEMLEHRFRYRYFQCFVGAAAGVRGYRIAEVDTDFEPRRAGESFLSKYPICVSLRICAELVKYRAETWRIDSSAAKGRGT